MVRNKLLAGTAAFDDVSLDEEAAEPTVVPGFDEKDSEATNLAKGRVPTKARRDGRPQPARGPPVGRKFLSYADLVERGIRFSRVHLRRLELAGKFPPHVTLGSGSGTAPSIAWLMEEIMAWEDARVAERDGQIAQRDARMKSQREKLDAAPPP